MKMWLSALLALLMIIAPCAMAEQQPAQSEGYAIESGMLNVHVWENASTGYVWNHEIDDENVLIYDSESTDAPVDTDLVGAPNMHTWLFAPRQDGEALLTFSYERPEDFDSLERMLCYTVTVEGGAVVDVLMEDLGDDSVNGDDDAVVRFDGATGGVELMVPEGMIESESDDGALLVSDDGTMNMLIDYQPDDNADELFDQLKDETSAAEVYEDDEAGSIVISSSVDLDADPPCATLVLSTDEGFVVYDGYKAPDGGVLHVHTTYLFDMGDEPLDEYDDDDVDPLA